MIKNGQNPEHIGDILKRVLPEIKERYRNTQNPKASEINLEASEPTGLPGMPSEDFPEDWK